MSWTAVGAIFMGLAVGMGAFGAHALKERLDDYSQGIWEKAVFYHFIHGIGILLVALLARTGVLGAAGGSACLLADGPGDRAFFRKPLRAGAVRNAEFWERSHRSEEWPSSRPGL